jgi:hypothetical protein
MDSWDRQPDEPRLAFEAFLAYRNLGPERTVVGYRQKEGKPGAKQASGRWNAWAGRFSWAFRADQWDAWLQQAVNGELRRRARAEAERDAELVAKLSAAAVIAIEKLTTALETGGVVPTASGVAHLSDVAVKLHRLITDVPPEAPIGRTADEVDSAREELARRLDRIAARLADQQASSK